MNVQLYNYTTWFYSRAGCGWSNLATIYELLFNFEVISIGYLPSGGNIRGKHAWLGYG